MGGKFCLKGKDHECNTAKHDKIKFGELMNELYVRGTGADAYCTPCIPKEQLSENVITALLAEDFADLGEARKTLDFILASGGEIENLSSLGSILKAPSPRFFTSVKKEAKVLNLRAEFDSILKGVLDDEKRGSESVEGLEKARLFNEYLVELTSTVESNQMDVE